MGSASLTQSSFLFQTAFDDNESFAWLRFPSSYWGRRACNLLCSGITWMTKEGIKKPNYWGSLTQASTCRVGNYKGEEMYIPFSKMLPMVHPNDIVLGGWDISGHNLADAMERAQARASTSAAGVQPLVSSACRKALFWEMLAKAEHHQKPIKLPSP